MQKEFYFDDNPECTIWDNMWEARTIEQELEDCEVEAPPRELFLKYLAKSDRVVDAGCGFGKWVIYLHRLGYDIVGVDNNELAVRKLKEFDGSLQVEEGDILNINHPDNSFDAYISMGVVEHFEEGPQTALNEAYRLIRPGGLVFVSVPTVNMVRRIYRRPVRNFVHAILRSIMMLVRDWNKSGLQAVKRAIENITPESIRQLLAGKNKRHYHFVEYRYTRAELEGFLKQAGFEVLETIPHDFSESRDYAIGIYIDFPFLRSFRKGDHFKLNPVGKLVSNVLNRISPWITCASVICVARSLKKAGPLK